MTDPTFETWAAEREIERVLRVYARGVDRLDLDAVRECYWPDAQDWHGTFRGSRDDFMVWVEGRLGEFERTVHYLANTLIEVQADGDLARVETYAMAYHRIAGTVERGPADLWIGLRYLDRFERRNGAWRIGARVVTYDWKREVEGQELALSPTHVWSERGPGDPLHWILEVDLVGRE
ncbi:nuclear transport factor 2 family protein [Aeromicrobium sp. zg-636]|uniref:Nuclear transport factor 2 family protein n=1 Tax=Aeromicrobium senzhongii TaxID=2663859 RepID=A0A8I0JZY3_9ACTN|nr:MULTISPECIES: nuclear transport factor 2 family protein [Aeromicrobium]MBC9226477.1 nuclear transport factor 2 family protein [Aeromicrobium senzhongii]